MSDLISESESEVKEASPDVLGTVKFAGYLVLGLLTLLGLTWFDLFGLKGKAKTTQAEAKDDEDTQADYEKEYLDEEISEEALDEHETGLTS